MNSYLLTPKPGTNMQPLLDLAQKLDIRVETIDPASDEDRFKDYISVDEFCDRLRERLEKRYANASR